MVLFNNDFSYWRGMTNIRNLGGKDKLIENVVLVKSRQVDQHTIKDSPESGGGIDHICPTVVQ
jgi:hypothetical protein